jgi:hypothetical protein
VGLDSLTSIFYYTCVEWREDQSRADRWEIFLRAPELCSSSTAEQILRQDPRVEAAIMFGRERPHAGVIIAPSEDVLDVESFRNTIWYYIR